MDVLQLNEKAKLDSSLREIGENVTQIKREYSRKGLTLDEFADKVQVQNAKKLELMQEYNERVSK